MAGDYPVAGFVLALIGGILEIIAGIPLALLGGFAGFIGGLAAAPVVICLIWPLICGILIIVGAVWMKSGEPDKVKKGGILTLIFAILGGFNILALIGGILGMIWKPPQRAPPPTAPPPPPPPPPM